MSDEDVKARLEYLRGEIDAQRISYSELYELQTLADHIEPGDTQLLEWAGVPEHTEDVEETITAAMLIRYLATMVAPDAVVVVHEDDFAGEGDFVALDRALADIREEPERYKD